MSLDPRHHVLPGQPLRLAADQVNALNRMMRVSAGMTAGPIGNEPIASNIAFVRNSSGSAVPWLGVLGIDGVVIDPSGGFLDGTNAAASRARDFARRPVLIGISPQSTSGFRIAVAMEPIPVGGVGKCAVGGVFACKVKRHSFSHIYAGALSGDVTQLQSVICGPVRLLWVESGTGNDKWAVGSM